MTRKGEIVVLEDTAIDRTKLHFPHEPRSSFEIESDRSQGNLALTMRCDGKGHHAVIFVDPDSAERIAAFILFHAQQLKRFAEQNEMRAEEAR